MHGLLPKDAFSATKCLSRSRSPHAQQDRVVLYAPSGVGGSNSFLADLARSPPALAMKEKAQKARLAKVSCFRQRASQIDF